MTENDPVEKQPDDRLQSLMSAVGGLATRGPALVHLWHPPFRGDIAMRIAADGTWYYEGSPITRPAMVRLFASILRKDEQRFVLVTPAECLGIEVEDAPFAAVAMAEHEGKLSFVTNLGEEIEAGDEHPLRFTTEADGGVKPYVLVRDGLWARLTRSLAIELIDRVEERDGTQAIRSGTTVFPI